MKEYNHVVKGIDPKTDAFAGAVYSDIINMKNHEHIQFLVYKGVGLTGTSVITVEACDDVIPTNVVAIPFRYQVCESDDAYNEPQNAEAAGFTTIAGSSQVYKIDVDAAALTKSDYSYIRLKAVEVVDSPVAGSIMAILTESKYNSAVQDTVLE